MITIKKNNKKYAYKVTSNDFKDGLSFFSEDNDFLQIGAWCYSAGKVLPAHNHNTVTRTINRTQETIVVMSGNILASIYTEDDELIDELRVDQGEILVLLSGGHGYKILTDDTRVLEVKNGPYPGADADRRRLLD